MNTLKPAVLVIAAALGLGDIYPTGGPRLLTGIEALTGLLMLSWTASFTYLEMRRYWEY